MRMKFSTIISTIICFLVFASSAVAQSNSPNGLACPPCTSGNLVVNNGAGVVDAGVAPGAAASLGVGGGLSSSGGNIVSNSVNHISFQPGLMTTVLSAISAFHKFSKASTVNNIEASANSLTCGTNPTVTMYECGTSATCTSPTTIGTVTMTTTGTVVDGTVSSPSITAGDYVAFAITAGVCTALDLSVSAQTTQN